MERMTYAGNQKRIEGFMVVVYSIYCVAIIVLSEKQQWGMANTLLLAGTLMAIWILYIGRYKTYEFRAKVSAVFMQGGILIYMMKVENLSQTLPILCLFVVLWGVYGIANIVWIAVAATMFIFFWHGVVLKTMPGGSPNEIMDAVAQIANMLLLEYVVYIWTKKNYEGSTQLLKVIDELRIVQNSKDDFVANVSHEIRTPINTICGMSDIILQEELPYRVKENVQNIQLAGRNLMGVVSDILDFSELQSGKIELEEEAYNITSTINDVINMTMAWKDEKKVELIVDCDANIPCALLGDEKKLRRVIMNLVDNAIKFTDEGCVSIGIGYRKESYGINLVISVKDTGIGMSAESLEKIFTGFNQVDASTKRQEGGLGLGLAISHALVKKMGGAITMKSKLGRGTTVKVVVPQKVLSEDALAVIQDKENVNVATYIDMEQFDRVEIRDEYTNMIIHMVEQLKGKCQICRNLAELQRRESKERFSHIFISIVEYKEDQAYFDELAKKTRVIVVLDRFDEKYITNQDVLKIYKPFYILTIVSVLNGLNGTGDGLPHVSTQKFVTRDAHVLVVDDNHMNLRVVEELLANYRIKVTTAVSGKEALQKIVSADYDFVFMDHMMPEMDGVETLHLIRRMVGTYYQKVPIVALTANAVAGTRETLLKEGFSDFLEKPIERSVLDRVLRRNLPDAKIIYGAVESKETAQTEEGIPVMEGLDVKQGILYCNGREQYIKILRGYCEDWKKSGMELQELFEKQDWKNYTIMVHGLKSAMKSIGAMELSEIARKLEAAGKEGRIEYILKHQEELMEEYRILFMTLRQNELICPIKEEPVHEVDISQIPVLEEDAFLRMLEEMEDATYSLNGERMMEIMDELQKYQYCGKALKEELAPMRRKIEMSDYVSAVESIARWKNGLSK